MFSGKLKDLTNEEMLALFSVLLDRIKASKGHEMLQSRVSDAFWDACIWLEKTTQGLIASE